MATCFSTNLKYLREKKGLSQNKLAEMIGVNQTTIARWEDDNRIPTISNAVDISKALNISLTELITSDLRLGTELDDALLRVSNELNIPFDICKIIFLNLNMPNETALNYNNLKNAIINWITDKYAIFTGKDNEIVTKYSSLSKNSKEIADNMIDTLYKQENKGSDNKDI